MLTAVLPSLLWVLGLSYAVHIISRYRRLDSSIPLEEALGRALGESRTGVTFSALTTVLGFLSLLVGGLPPVRELGMFGALGMVLAFMASQTVVPLLVQFLRVPRGAERDPGLPPAAGSACAHRRRLDSPWRCRGAKSWPWTRTATCS